MFISYWNVIGPLNSPKVVQICSAIFLLFDHLKAIARWDYASFFSVCFVIILSLLVILNCHFCLGEN